MTDLPDDIEELLAKVEATQKRSHRVYRRVTLLAAGMLLLLALLNAGMALMGASFVHDPWLYRNLIAIGGLTLLGMMGHVGAVHAFHVLVGHDAELLKHMRREAELAMVVDEMRPLMAAITDARARGMSLVIPPLKEDGTPTVNIPDQHTVH